MARPICSVEKIEIYFKAVIFFGFGISNIFNFLNVGVSVMMNNRILCVAIVMATISFVGFGGSRVEGAAERQGQGKPVVFASVVYNIKLCSTFVICVCNDPFHHCHRVSFAQGIMFKGKHQLEHQAGCFWDLEPGNDQTDEVLGVGLSISDSAEVVKRAWNAFRGLFAVIDSERFTSPIIDPVFTQDIKQLCVTDLSSIIGTGLITYTDVPTATKISVNSDSKIVDREEFIVGLSQDGTQITVNSLKSTNCFPVESLLRRGSCLGLMISTNFDGKVISVIPISCAENGHSLPFGQQPWEVKQAILNLPGLWDENGHFHEDVLQRLLDLGQQVEDPDVFPQPSATPLAGLGDGMRPAAVKPAIKKRPREDDDDKRVVVPRVDVQQPAAAAVPGVELADDSNGLVFEMIAGLGDSGTRDMLTQQLVTGIVTPQQMINFLLDYKA